MRIPISEITVNPGRRELDLDDVKELADSIRELGLLHPIIVDKKYTLIAGLHRLEAVKLLEWTEIECTVSSLEGLKAELAEIDENVVRSDLSALEFGELLLKRKDIYEALHPEARATYNGGGFRGNQHKKTNQSVVGEESSATTKSFVQDTAEKLGVTPRTVEKQIQTARNLTPEVKTMIRETDTKIGKEAALKLSRMEPEQQKEAVEMLSTGEVRSVEQYSTLKSSRKKRKRNRALNPPPAICIPASMYRWTIKGTSLSVPISHTVCQTGNSAVLRSLSPTSKTPTRIAAVRRISFLPSIPASFISSLRISSGTPLRNTQRCFPH